MSAVKVWRFVIAVALGLVAFLWLFPFQGADTDPPYHYNVFGKLISRSPDVGAVQLKALLLSVVLGVAVWFLSRVLFAWLRNGER